MRSQRLTINRNYVEVPQALDRIRSQFDCINTKGGNTIFILV